MSRIAGMAHPIGRADGGRLGLLALAFAYLLLITVCLWSLAASGELSGGRNPLANLLKTVGEFASPSFLDLWFGNPRLEYRSDDDQLLRVEDRRAVEAAFLGELARASWTTFRIATLGSLLGALLGLPLALLTAHNLGAPRAAAWFAKTVLDAARPIHTLVFGLVLVGIVGHNGAGKSTLLRLLKGFVTPTEGVVEVLGRRLGPPPAADLRALRRDVGQVMQGLHLVARLSALDNVLVGCLGRLAGWRSWTRLFPGDEAAAAREALRAVGLGDRCATRADRLSGGERQKVAIARMLLQRPRLILADEPTAALDPAAAGEVCALLAKAAGADRGVTLLSVVHSPALLPFLCERVIGLAHGRIVFDRPLAAVGDDGLASLYRPPPMPPRPPSALGAPTAVPTGAGKTARLAPGSRTQQRNDPGPAEEVRARASSRVNVRGVSHRRAIAPGRLSGGAHADGRHAWQRLGTRRKRPVGHGLHWPQPAKGRH